MSLLPLNYLLLLFPILILSVSADSPTNTTTTPCRSYCGNLTIDYPFAIRSGCGHSGFRDLLFCVNDVLMFHITSGSYRVLEIDYAYHTLTLHDPAMSNCDTILRDGKGNGFILEPWRNPYLNPAPDNIFMLIGCNAQSPLFQGFPEKHLPCRNVSSMGCEEYQACPAWSSSGSYKSVRNRVYGVSPPECCSVSFESIRSINLTRLRCQGYSSAYSVAPLKVWGPNAWSYGIRVSYSVPGDFAFCRACEATGGTCGYDALAVRDLCLCGGWNSTSNCDKASSTGRRMLPYLDAVAGIL
ncbi:Wall-associated receptor kinase galacturonan-binding domain [Macleaya cordata]|uniref:Wall-associated receptor kinase galacturonan-binding domain n=1 Tax=Macleaya cordata TaxID=56857 RepID=A0A200RDH2_MACCD|nr:Wall-associated receptor kinase galacturonan-binding domain [Macleaya cordata]